MASIAGDADIHGYCNPILQGANNAFGFSNVNLKVHVYYVNMCF